MSTSSAEKRIEALEDRHAERDLVTIIRIMPLCAKGAESDIEPVSADVGGRLIQRADDESAEAFLARVEAEAKLAAKPGCTVVALVSPALPGDLK